MTRQPKGIEIVSEYAPDEEKMVAALRILHEWRPDKKTEPVEEGEETGRSDSSERDHEIA